MTAVAVGTSLGAAASLSRTSPAVCGQGTGFDVRENVWTRQLTEDGRIYYFNRATGGSQWHVPDDLYEGGNTKSQMSQGSQMKSTSPAGDGCMVVFPTHAKATLRVDCVTEVPAVQDKRHTSAAGQSVASAAVSVSAMEAVHIIEHNPHATDKIFEFLPVALADLLRSPEFLHECDAGFHSVSNGVPEVTFPECFSLVFGLAAALGADPPLQVTVERLQILAGLFDEPDLKGVVDSTDFVNFTVFVLAVHYLEQAATLGAEALSEYGEGD